MQDRICLAIENADGESVFKEDKWKRAEGGGGITRIIENGIIEKGGVNTSVVYGDVTNTMKTQLGINGSKWFACGLSLVLHPENPFAPTVHCNYRMFELYDNDKLTDRWFGGGTDLTPFYLYEDDAVHFHSVYKDVCDKYNESFYPEFKRECDNYFVNTHRDNERRGVGGIFYDHKRNTENMSDERWMGFAEDCGNAFIDAYIPLLNKRKNTPYTGNHKDWQSIRRGRYVEFNLV